MQKGKSKDKHDIANKEEFVSKETCILTSDILLSKLMALINTGS